MKDIGYRLYHQAFDTLAMLFHLFRLPPSWWLVCPGCHNKGSYLPMGGWWNKYVMGDRSHRRWMCKWCGYYVDTGGLDMAVYNSGRGSFALESELSEDEKTESFTDRELVLLGLVKDKLREKEETK